MKGHGLVVRTSLEPDGQWLAVAETVPVGVARAAVAGGDLPETEAARAEQRKGPWPVETALAGTELAAVLEAVRRLLSRWSLSQDGSVAHES